jgi:hypothetical protein
VSSFDRDFDWQRGLLPEVKRILANHLIVEAPAEEDMQHNTDLIVLKLDTVRVACRLRHYEYLFLKDYKNEFTIRSERRSGVDTELPKMLSGWGDYIFYGFANQEATELLAWVLGNLKVFRLWHHRELWAKRRPGEECRNGDGSSFFMAYRIADLPAEFVVARQTYLQGARRDAKT